MVSSRIFLSAGLALVLSGMVACRAGPEVQADGAESGPGEDPPREATAAAPRETAEPEVLAPNGADAGAASSAEPEDSSSGYPANVARALAERGLKLGESVGRIVNLQNRMQGWNRIDNQHLIITVDVAEKYLVRLVRYCRGLDDVERIQFTAVGADMTDKDQIRVHGSAGLDICQVSEIRRLARVQSSSDGGNSAIDDGPAGGPRPE